MEQIEFKVKFITPLLIHGADSREVDNIGLTGKALRGCWRFWFRAIVGGMAKDISKDKDKLLELEGKIFGSSDENVGAKFRMLVEPLSVLKSDTTEINFSWRPVNFKGYKEGCEFSIKLAPRSKMDNEEIKILVSTIWLWGNLGGIGQRARRGFGSPMIYVDKNNNIFENLFKDSPLPIKQSFENINELKDCLRCGIKTAWDTVSNWCKNLKISNFNPPVYDSNSKPPVNAPLFMVSSFKQITVADKSVEKDVKKALNKIHGSNACPELGTANPRKASPVFIRLHMVNNEYYPVITWSEPKGSGCARDYILKNCNCKSYLDGSAV